jgi:hypothetical protein
MSFTMDDFRRQYVKEHFRLLTPEERREALASLAPDERRGLLQWLPVEELLTHLSAEHTQQLRDRLVPSRPARPRKPRRQR